MSLTRPVAGLQTPGLAKTGRASRARRVFSMLLGALRSGSVRVTFPDGVTQDLGSGSLAAQLTIRDESVFGHTLAYGDIGFAECWMDGRWSVDDLAALLTVLARDRDAIARGLHGEVLFLLGHKLWTLFRANTRRGARKNIEAHYDLGNDFYRLWLDPTMTYSSAWFGENCAGEVAASTGLSLEDAQRAMGLCRHHARDWGIDPACVGILGFSAGANLAGHAAWDPGRAARLYVEGRDIRLIGELHPRHVQAMELGRAPVMFEIDLGALPRVAAREALAPARTPAVRRDLAVVVEEAVQWRQIASAIASPAIDHLTEIVPFDIYRGQGIESGKKSLAIAMTIQDTRKTLTDNEIEAVVNAVVERLASAVGASLRQ
jgi:hypothetical protein